MLKILLLLLLLYFLAGLFLFVKQRDLMYFPTAESSREDTPYIRLKNDDESLKIWHINQGKPAILYFGGNAESVEYNLENFQRIFPDHTVYLMNYRGFGGSSGKPSEKALFGDALKLYDSIKNQHQQIHVIGRSLGSGVASFLAEQRPVNKLVLITPYDSIMLLARSHYPIFPIRWMLLDHFDSLSRASKLDNEMLILLAEQDRVVPHRHSYNLIGSLTSRKVETSIIPNTRHDTILDSGLALEKLERFFRKQQQRLD